MAVIHPGDTLAIHPGALGDVLLAIPALRSLKAQHPGRHLVLAAQPRIGDLLASLGVVNRAIDFEALGLGALFTDEPGRGPQSPLESAGRVVCWFGSRDPLFVRNLCVLSPEAIVASPAAGDIPVWQHLCRTVGAGRDDLTGTVPVPDAAREAGREALADAGWDGVAPFVLLHPGAGSAAKQWAAEGFAAVAGALPANAVGPEAKRRARAAPGVEPHLCDPVEGAAMARVPTVVVHRGPADVHAAAALVGALGGDAVVLAEPSLSTLAGALAGAALYLGNDSGVRHLAASIGAPSVLLYTRRLLAWRPWAPGARLIAVSTEELIPAEVEAVTDVAREAMA